AFAAAGDVHLLAGFRQIFQNVAAVAIEHQGAGRHIDDEVFAFTAMAVSRPAAAPLVRSPVLAIDDLGQAIGARYGADNDTAAIAAVAAVRPTARNVLLAAKADTAAAAVAAFYINGYAINEHEKAFSYQQLAFSHPNDWTLSQRYIVRESLAGFLAES